VRTVAFACAALLLLVGCSDPPGILDSQPPPGTPYAGSLVGAHAAQRALECQHPAYRDDDGADLYLDGLHSVKSSYTDAVRDIIADELWSLVPRDGYRLERDDGDRVLLVWEVGGRTKAAFVLNDDVLDYKRHRGWGVQSFAQCDPAEFPESVTDKLGIGVWRDAEGHRVPITRIESFPGQGYCHYDGIAFLRVGPDGSDATVALRDTEGRLAGVLRGRYDGAAQLPADAVASGYRWDGKEAWLVPSKDAVYLVDLDDPTRVERWPALKRGVACPD